MSRQKTNKRKRKSRGRALITIIILCILVAVCCGYILKMRGDKGAETTADPSDAILSANEDVKKGAEKAAGLGDWRLLLVNPWNRMPDDLKVETTEIEGGYVVDSRIRDDMAEMLSDCRAAGYSPQVISTFRTRELQQQLYNTTANKDDTAYPGTSEHECGLAADIIDSGSAGWGDPLIKEQEDMPAQKWLMSHCQDYGFILRYPEDKEDITGIIYEPWHYRYVGKEHAAKIMESGVCLEEYLADEYGVQHTTGSKEERVSEQ